MIRSQFCEISGIEVPTFNTHRRNGALPFDVSKYEEADARGRMWVRYNIFAAARMIAAINLASSQGVTWSHACEILRADSILCSGGGRPFETPGIHVARAEFLDHDGKMPFLRSSVFTVYEGRIEAIGVAVAAEVEGFNARLDVVPIHLASLVSVNLSQAFQTAYARAEALGVELGKDGQIEADQ